VLTSCSHRGVVNIVKRAQAVSGVAKVHAVMGGFHLAPFKEDYVRQTIAGLKEIDPDYVVPMHCTGEPFWDLARAEMPALARLHRHALRVRRLTEWRSAYNLFAPARLSHRSSRKFRSSPGWPARRWPVPFDMHRTQSGQLRKSKPLWFSQ